MQLSFLYFNLYGIFFWCLNWKKLIMKIFLTPAILQLNVTYSLKVLKIKNEFPHSVICEEGQISTSVNGFDAKKIPIKRIFKPFSGDIFL